MSNADIESRKQMTFEQAEGIEPPPGQHKLKEISPELRALLWVEIHNHLQAAGHFNGIRGEFLQPWLNIFKTMHILRDHGMIDEFVNHQESLTKKVKRVISRGDYAEVFGWIQWVLRDRNCPKSLAKGINGALDYSRAAYRVFDGDTIAPLGSDAERETLERGSATSPRLSSREPGRTYETLRVN